MSASVDPTGSFRSLLEITGNSVAHPPWFAMPVDVEEDDASITVLCHIPSDLHRRVRVRANDRSVTVWAGRPRSRPRAVRLLTLPERASAEGIKTKRVGDLLRVRFPKSEPRPCEQDP